jgi:hypothetical protein
MILGAGGRRRKNRGRQDRGRNEIADRSLYPKYGGFIAQETTLGAPGKNRRPPEVAREAALIADEARVGAMPARPRISSHGIVRRATMLRRREPSR